jgi:hypothetical protein
VLLAGFVVVFAALGLALGLQMAVDARRFRRELKEDVRRPHEVMERAERALREAGRDRAVNQRQGGGRE